MVEDGRQVVMSDVPSGGVPAPVARRGDLFEALESAVDVGFSTARRIELDQTSWVEHVPNWLHGSVSLFDELMATAPWEQRYRYIYGRRITEPRLTAEYKDIADAPQQLLRSVTAVLAQRYGVAYRYVWINLYRTQKYGTTPDGRIFQTTRGGIIQDSAYSAVWAEARQAALTEAQFRSPLGRRPYDLRHAAVSLWLNSGVPATEVARQAGHGVAVLLKIYAHCIDGQADAANQRITDALSARDAEPEPGGGEDGDGKKAT